METFDKKIERNCYYVAVSLLICVVFIFIFHPIKAENFNTCIAYQYFHIYCPGCGGTRAIYALFRGDLLRSFLYHPLVIYMAVVVGVYILRYTLYLLSKEKLAYMRLRAVYFYGAIIIIFIQWFIKLGFIFLKGVYIID